VAALVEHSEGRIHLPAIFDNNTAKVVFERPHLVEQMKAAIEESKILSLERAPDFARDYLFAEAGQEAQVEMVADVLTGNRK
jgi:hypothetical protein